jgi:hypothetical protein
MVEKFPDFFEKEVLERVESADRAFFAQVSHGCRAVVLASGLPCAGTRMGLGQLNPAACARLAQEVRKLVCTPDYGFAQGLALSLGCVESSDLPRAGGVVRLDLTAFCTAATRLAWAQASGCRWDERTYALAAMGGHLEALRWAREHGCRWYTSPKTGSYGGGKATCRYAAEGGHLEMLKWLREDGRGLALHSSTFQLDLSRFWHKVSHIHPLIPPNTS